MNANKGKITLMDRDRIERTIRRIAWQIAEKAGEKEICIIGLNERGYAVAQEITLFLERASSNRTTLLPLNAARVKEEAGAIRENHSLESSFVVLVDDVIFSGKTMFTALQHLVTEPNLTVATAVLVDRGNRRLPVASVFTGLDIPTKPREHVEVTLKGEKADEVFLYRD